MTFVTDKKSIKSDKYNFTFVLINIDSVLFITKEYIFILKSWFYLQNNYKSDISFSNWMKVKKIIFIEKYLN